MATPLAALLDDVAPAEIYAAVSTICAVVDDGDDTPEVAEAEQVLTWWLITGQVLDIRAGRS